MNKILCIVLKNQDIFPQEKHGVIWQNWELFCVVNKESLNNSLNSQEGKVEKKFLHGSFFCNFLP